MRIELWGSRETPNLILRIGKQQFNVLFAFIMLTNPQNEQAGQVQLFTNPSFGTIRTAGNADYPLFCLKDLCEILGLDSRVVVRRLTKGVHLVGAPLRTAGGLQQANFATEAGLFKVIFQSRKPEAEAFTDWVTSVVLPSIRKTGSYGRPSDSAYDRLVGVLERLDQRISALEGKRVIPMNCPALEKGEGQWSLGEIAKELGTHPYALQQILVSIRLATRHHREIIATRRAEGKGYFVNVPYPRYEDPAHLIVTEKGRKEIVSAFPTYKKQHPYI